MRHSRLFAILLFILFAAFQSDPARAQVSTFYYIGAPFSISDCHGLDPTLPCVNGSITASVTLPIGPGGSGSFTETDVLGWSMSASNVGSTSGSLFPARYTISNGVMQGGWQMQGVDDPHTSHLQIYTVDASGGYDVGDSYDSMGHVVAYGFQVHPPIGFCLSPASLGPSCPSIAPTDAPPKPGGSDCGDPVSVGSGNMFEAVQDYSTVRQNPLAFSRYYNSMSLPDTFAVALGSNWRHSFDRYLHIINPSAIYGVTAERETGQYVSFSSSSGTYTTSSDLDYSLTKSGSTWTLTDPDDTVETYSQSGAEATLSTIKLRNGYTQTMHYTSGRLSSVSDTYGRTLGLSYSYGLLTGLTTPDSLNLTYGYVAFSSNGHLLSTVTYNTSPATHQTYAYANTNYPAALTGITDENGHSYASWTYDSSGRMATSQLSGGVNFTSVSYFDSDGHRNVTGPLGIAETYKFTTLQGVPKVSEIDRASNGTVASANEKFLYDSNGFTKSVTDWNSNNTWFTNNSHGLPTSIVFASGSTVSHTTSITYDTTWARLAHVVTTPGLTTTLNYDSSGNLSTRVDADTTSTSTPYSTNGQTRTWTYTYTIGQFTSVRLPRTDVYAKTAYGYSGGVLNFSSDALGHTITANTFTPGGRWTKITDQNGVQTQITYSSRLWLTSSVLLTSAGNLTTSLQYDSAGELTKFTRPDNSYLSYAYDNAHQLTKITNALNETANFTYDSAGDLTQTQWKTSGNTTKHRHNATFDALGRMLTDKGGVTGQTTTFGYDSNGNVTSIKSPLNKTTTQTFDALNRLKTSTNPVHDLAQISYDSHGRALTVTDGKSNVTSFVYDGFGDTIQQVSPDTGTSVFWYNPDGDVTKQSAFAVSNYTYDALDRVLTTTYPADSTLNVAYTWDQTTGHGSGVGRLTSQTDQAGSLSLTWDQRGLLTSHDQTISSTTYTTGYSYQSAGRLASITYPTASWKVSYTRDAAGQVTAVADKPPSSGAVNLATSITHMPFGPVSGFTYGNGVTDTRTYDLDYRMASVKDVGTSNIQYLSFGYDADSNPTTIPDNVTTANNQTLTYDAIDRLTSATGGYGTISSITFDSNSNRKAYGGATYTVPSGSDKMSAVGASAITYSSTGNMTGVGATTSMSWNKANRMASITVSGTTTNFTYGADGYRLTETTGANPTIVYRYGQDGMLLSESRTTETDYAWLDPGTAYGSFPIAMIVPGTSAVSAIHTDNLGTPKKATNASKTVVWGIVMTPNGAGTISPSTITMSLRWPGQHNDAASYSNNGFRTFQPKDVGGRYLEADPIGLAGGLNPYPYAGNNPFKNTDRLGLLPDPVKVGLGVAFGGAAGYAVGGTKGAIIGGIAGGGAAFVSPVLSGAVGTSVATRVLTSLGVNAVAAAGATAVTNYSNNVPDLTHDIGPAILISTGAPLLSGEAILVGGGYVEWAGAERALAFNTGLIGLEGTFIDANRGNVLPPPNMGAPTPGSSCQVTPAFMPPLFAPGQ
jgi:RHS repeat-associated protein